MLAVPLPSRAVATVPVSFDAATAEILASVTAASASFAVVTLPSVGVRWSVSRASFEATKSVVAAAAAVPRPETSAAAIVTAPVRPATDCTGAAAAALAVVW